jgi:hypothetical protein
MMFSVARCNRPFVVPMQDANRRSALDRPAAAPQTTSGDFDARPYRHNIGWNSWRPVVTNDPMVIRPEPLSK